MTQAVLAAHSYLTRAIELFIDYFKSLNEARYQRKLRNETIKELSKLTDKELNDIGLARGDIYYVATHLKENENLKGWV